MEIGTCTVKLKMKLNGYGRIMRKSRRLKRLLLQVAELHAEISETPIVISFEHDDTAYWLMPTQVGAYSICDGGGVNRSN